jgi:hypothetical protein
MCCSEDYDQKELWRRKFPAIIAAFLSVFQMIFTAVIVGCEIGGDFINFSQMNIFVGYWTFPFFMCAWISLAGASMHLIFIYLTLFYSFLLIIFIRLLLSKSLLRNHNTSFSMSCNTNGIMCNWF